MYIQGLPKVPGHLNIRKTNHFRKNVSNHVSKNESCSVQNKQNFIKSD